MSAAMTAALIALAAVIAGCGGTAAAPDKPAPVSELADNCTTSEDCDLVDACCGCNAGGRKIAIRKDAVAAFNASRDQRCGGQLCAQVISQDPSCDAEAVCGNRNRCRVAPHMQHR
jgi:hypothetical protein